ncbi:hypothetical protein V1477_009045 [Vespula maculifrons]|uniref:Uncharacterized protein n=1 Tax=Vespula maculifrons TaxID=7453 RepID=A0ABD2CER3_VESMC
MPFRFGSFELLSKLEMYKTPLTDCSAVHTVGFRHLETRPVVSTFRFQRTKRSPRQKIDFGKALKYAAIRPVVLVLYNFRYNLNIDFDISQVLPTQVPPRGGLLLAPENTTSVPANIGVSVLPILPKFMRKDFGKILKNTAICSVILAVYKITAHHKYFRPRSHREEVAASGDPRTNGDSTFNNYYYYQKSKATGQSPLHDEFKPPNAKIAAPCVSAFGNRLTHSSTIQHRKLRSPLEHNRSCFRDKRRNPKLNPTALTVTYTSIPETLRRVC